ncbi:MAG: hypothetical protein ACREIV_10025, partial [Planctomycetaceae bacterium]
LPEGYSATNAMVPAGQSPFELIVKTPPDAAANTIKATLKATAAGGETIQADRMVELKIVPASP